MWRKQWLRRLLVIWWILVCPDMTIAVDWALKCQESRIMFLCCTSTRNLPRAILISMCTVICVYLVANIAYLGVLSPQQMTQSTAVAVVSGSQNWHCCFHAVSSLKLLSSFTSNRIQCCEQKALLYFGMGLGHVCDWRIKFVEVVLNLWSGPWVKPLCPGGFTACAESAARAFLAPLLKTKSCCV